MAQVVLAKDDPPSELNERVSALTAESAVTLVGTVAADERVNLGGLELKLEELEVDSLAEPEVPIAPDSALDKRIDWRYLDLRRPDRKLIFEVQTTTERAMREFWAQEQLHRAALAEADRRGDRVRRRAVQTRVLRSHGDARAVAAVLQADGDGGGLRQGVRGRPGVPRQPVVHLAPRHGVHERRHGDLVDRLARGRDVLRGALARARARGGQGGARRADRARHSTRRSSCRSCRSRGSRWRTPRSCCARPATTRRRRGHDLDPPSERALSAIVKERHGHEFAFVTDYPTSVRPFYHMRYEDRPTVTKSFDLLWRGIELTTGAQREHRYDRLLAQAEEKKVDIEAIQLLPRLLPLRRAAARRLRLRPDASVDADARAGERARGDVPVSRAASARAVRPRQARRRHASERRLDARVELRARA